VHTEIQKQNKTQTSEKNTPKTTPTRSARPHTHKEKHNLQQNKKKKSYFAEGAEEICGLLSCKGFGE
jgi:hypothetical protein